MALSVTEIRARMNREYTIFEIESDLQIDIIRLSVINLIEKLHIPILSVVLSVIPNQVIYPVPLFLRSDKVVDVRDSSSKSIDYSIDRCTGSLIFKSIPEIPVNWAVYGLPSVSSENIETIVSAIPESVEDILSLYIDYWVHQKRKEASAPTLLQIAESMAQKKKRSFDNRLDIDYTRSTLMKSVASNTMLEISDLTEGF